MPTPTSEPTAEELVTLAEIVMMTVEEATSMVSSDSDQDIVNAKWDRTLQDIELWSEIENETGDVKKIGSIEFFENKAGEGRLAFRNKIRTRYGIELLVSEKGDSGFAVSSTNWF